MERNSTLDILKLLMALMVVGIHFNPFAILGYDWILLTGQGAFRVAVPAFFILNGFFMLSAIQSGRIVPYLRRLGFLYLGWMMIYTPFWGDDLLEGTFTEGVKLLLVGYWHLWFVPALALASGMMWLMRGWSTQQFLMVAAILFLIGSGLHFGQALGLWTIALNTHRNGLFVGLPFVILGVVLRRHPVQDSASPVVWTALASVAVILLAVESFALNRLAPEWTSHDNLFMTALAAPLLVLAALSMPAVHLAFPIGRYAAGIYFGHAATLDIAFRIGLTWPPVIWAATVVLALFMVWTLQRIGFGRQLL